MRVTETHLRSLIREVLLREARYTPDNLPDDFSFKLRVSGFGNRIIVMVMRDGASYGGVEATRITDPRIPCLDAFQVIFSKASRSGMGPMIYDIAMEAATELGGGLMSDRVVVSDDAQRVWKKYQNDRSDVDRIQLDSEENELTPTHVDNCDVNIAKSFGEDGWPDHPLAAVYRKPGMETIRRLVSMKKLQVDGLTI